MRMHMTALVQVNVSLTRINKFMNSEELDPDNVSHDEEFQSPVVAQKASFAWTDPEKPTLRELSFRVPEGSMTAVVGAVGSGKSSLLSALLGEMKRTRGTVNVFGKVAYYKVEEPKQRGFWYDGVVTAWRSMNQC